MPFIVIILRGRYQLKTILTYLPLCLIHLHTSIYNIIYIKVCIPFTHSRRQGVSTIAFNNLFYLRRTLPVVYVASAKTWDYMGLLIKYRFWSKLNYSTRKMKKDKRLIGDKLMIKELHFILLYFIHLVADNDISQYKIYKYQQKDMSVQVSLQYLQWLFCSIHICDLLRNNRNRVDHTLASHRHRYK